MHAYVFTDVALAKRAGQFAWLSIDTEKAENTEFQTRFPTQGVPSFLIVDPNTEKAAVQWYGTITVEQLDKLLDDGHRALAPGGGSEAEAALARADRLNAERKPGEAIAAYREALKAGGPDWPRRLRTTESLILALQLSDKNEECARTGLQEAPSLPRGQSFGNVASIGLSCAADLPAQNAGRTELIAGLRPLAEEALKQPGVFADDKANIYSYLVGLQREAKNDSAAKKIAQQWLEFLADDAKRAPNAEARASLDSWRVGAAMSLGDPAAALPALQESEHDLPNDYNPPARLALIYREMGKYGEALAATDRALAKAYGPRKLGIYNTRASIYEKMGDKEAMKRTIEEAVKHAESLPERQGARAAERLRKQLASLK